MSLTQEQKDLIFGTLLGDGNLQTNSDGKTWRYRALHSVDQKEYLFHKYEVLKPLCGENTLPSYSATFDKRTQKTYERWSFNTLTNPSLKFFGNLFYTYNKETKKWVKNVPNTVEKFLTPRAIAYWYMDDGSLKAQGVSNAMRISTDSFSLEEFNRLINALKNKYNIRTEPQKKRETSKGIQYTLFIPEESSSAFCDLIKPHLIESMKYKVSDGNNGHLSPLGTN